MAEVQHMIEKLNSYSLTENKIKQAILVLNNLDRRSFQLDSVNYCSKLECIYFKGILPNESDKRPVITVIPLGADTLISNERLHCLFSALNELEGQGIHMLTLALVGTDSSIVFYNLVSGIHPPNND